MLTKSKSHFSAMKSSSKKTVCAILAALAFGVAGRAGASYVNPYTTTPAIHMSPAETFHYLDQKTKNMFTQPASKPEPYVTPKGWKQDLDSLKNVRLEKYTADHKTSNKVVLQLHGGGYVLANTNRHRDWAIARAEAMGSGEVYMLDYRVFPEYEHPAALEDAAAAYQELLKSGISAKDIVVMGDSAGANLALTLALYLRDHDISMPNSIVLYSPYGDVADLPSHDLNVDRDFILGKRNPVMNDVVTINNYYFKDANLKDPYVSPVYGNYKGLPPILIIAGGSELFVDDCPLIEQRGSEAGVPVEVHLYRDMSHDWPLIFPEISESHDTYRVLEEFEKAH